MVAGTDPIAIGFPPSCVTLSRQTSVSSTTLMSREQEDEVCDATKMTRERTMTKKIKSNDRNK
ncbi:MAG: hypothetical protein WDN26_00685 [Chitinophagaceae bacterium]